MTHRDDPGASLRVVLTVAGTDSGGGAGVAADLKTFAALGVFGTLVVSGVTAQNTVGVTKIETVPTELVDAQLDAVLEDFPIAASKTGMLATVENVELIASRAATGALPNLVVDPVMIATSGAPLLEGDARRAYLGLIPFATVLTPNLLEAEALLDREIRTDAAIEQAGAMLGALGAETVVVKGGHRKGAEARDVIWHDDTCTWLAAPWVETMNVHGTGCTLSAAIAAYLARGEEPLEAIAHAKQFLSAMLEASRGTRIGHGPGPLAFLGMVR